MQKNNSEIGDIKRRFKKARQALNLSQTEMADRLGVHQSTVCRLEKGQKVRPNIEKMAVSVINEYEGKSFDSLEKVLLAVQSSTELKALVKYILYENMN